MNQFIRPAIQQMTGYTPGEQPRPGTPVIKLNTNENPYPPSPAALEVLRSLDSEWLRRYPTPYANDFRQAVSEVLPVPLDWIMVGNGSDELLNVIVRACVEPGRRVVYPTPTYVLYPTLAAMQAAVVVAVPYPADYCLPVQALVAAAGAVTLIASPNSPTAHRVQLAALRQLAAQLSGLLVIDEAYVDFADETALSLVNEFPNVIVVRTLSKGYSLAGLRLGFAIAHPNVLNELFKVKDSYNVDAIACLVGAAAMRDQAYKNDCIAKVKISRQKLADALKQLGFQVWESQTNFLLTQPPKRSAEYLYQALKTRGILVRYFNQVGLDDKLRITIGTDEQNQILIEALIALLNQ
ncbi:MAG: histidinol-phosphate transaminase [Leptolyngbyaceae cyanobacterium bins.349]|nr:histidinol-phosphate transaminase [Leptolyngbyaceae cyanobacterium bins.349]